MTSYRTHYRRRPGRPSIELAAAGSILAAFGTLALLFAIICLGEMPTHPRSGDLALMCLALGIAGSGLLAVGVRAVFVGVTGRR